MMTIAKTQLTALIIVAAVVASILLAMSNTASATNIVGKSRFNSEDIVAVGTTTTYATPVKHSEYGNVEVWLDPTAVPTNFAGTVILEQASSVGGPYVAVTPTAINSTSSLSYTTRTTPVVFVSDSNIGLYSRVRVSTTANVTGTVDTRWHLSNSEE